MCEDVLLVCPLDHRRDRPPCFDTPHTRLLSAGGNGPPAACQKGKGPHGGEDIVVPRDFKTKPIKCRDGTLVYPFSIPGRDAQLRRLKAEQFDVLVIGGGCVGAGGGWVGSCVFGGLAWSMDCLLN